MLNRKKLKFISFFILFGMVFFNIPSISILSRAEDIYVNIRGEDLPDPPQITAGAAVVLNLDSDKVIYEKFGNKIIFPGSTVKIMTAILVTESISDYEMQTIISQNVIDRTSGNNINMTAGEVFTINQLLHAMLVGGANDAAIALAEHVSGTEADFIVRMNEKARELGCENTVFTNSYGIHSESMYTTASDMAKIAKHAAKIQEIMDISSTPRYTIPMTNKTGAERPILNRNHFVSKASQSQHYYSYAKGINAGSTAESQYSLVTTATQKGVTYLCVVMGASSTKVPSTGGEIVNSFSDAKSLFEWAFSIYSYKTVLSKKDIVCEAKIKLAANKDYVGLVPDKEIDAVLPQNVDVKSEVAVMSTLYDDMLVAPIEKGQHLGDVVISYDGQVIGTAKLLSNSDIERSNILYNLSKINNIVSTRWFKASVTIFIIISVFYITVAVLRNSKKNKKRFY